VALLAVSSILDSGQTSKDGKQFISTDRNAKSTYTSSYALTATDERMTYLRIYADPEGESHMEEMSVALLPKEVFKDNLPLRLSTVFKAKSMSFCRVPAAMRQVNWHNPPNRKFVFWLSGEVEFETSDGDVRRVAAGSVVLAEDTTGKGHISRHPQEGQLLAFVDVE
jgi:hypothetical protein